MLYCQQHRIQECRFTGAALVAAIASFLAVAEQSSEASTRPRIVLSRSSSACQASIFGMCEYIAGDAAHKNRGRDDICGLFRYVIKIKHKYRRLRQTTLI